MSPLWDAFENVAEHSRVLGAGLLFRCRVSLLFTKSLYGIDTPIYVIDTFSHSHRSFFPACFFVRVKKQSDSRLSPIREYIWRIASVVPSYKMYISSKYKIHGQRRTILAKWFLHDLAWNIICVLQKCIEEPRGHMSTQSQIVCETFLSFANNTTVCPIV